jgi:hypothetical protein
MVAGGYSSTSHDYTASTVLLDTRTGYQVEGHPMVQARGFFSLLTIQTLTTPLVFAVGGVLPGGSTNATGYTATVESWEPVPGTEDRAPGTGDRAWAWTSRPELALPFPTGEHAAVAVEMTVKEKTKVNGAK